MAVHSIDAEDDQFAYRYDTQLLIDRRDKDLDEDEIAEYITENFEGNSLIAASVVKSPVNRSPLSITRTNTTQPTASPTPIPVNIDCFARFSSPAPTF